MLHEFLTQNRDTLVARCVAKVAKRPAPAATAAEMTHGIPLFLAQITEMLRSEAASGAVDPGKTRTATARGASAAAHGDELQKKGFTVDQGVHAYGAVSETITELAVEQEAPSTGTELRTLNRC